MAVLKMTLSSAVNRETLRQKYERPVITKSAVVQSVLNFVTGLVSGTVKGSPPSLGISIEEYATRASGTFTLDTVVSTDAVSINGVAFTAVASSPGANEFEVGGTDAETAENLAAAINASVSALVAGYVTAEAAGDVVTVYSTDYGIMGNQTLIASADSTIVASGARLAGGAADAQAKLYTF